MENRSEADEGMLADLMRMGIVLEFSKDKPTSVTLVQQQAAGLGTFIYVI